MKKYMAEIPEDKNGRQASLGQRRSFRHCETVASSVKSLPYKDDVSKLFIKGPNLQ